MNVWTSKQEGVHATGNQALRLRTPVTIGSLFGEWRVSWLGSWTKHRLAYLVMLVRVAEATQDKIFRDGDLDSQVNDYRLG
jgi:hypothetical protein